MDRDAPDVSYRFVVSLGTLRSELKEYLGRRIEENAKHEAEAQKIFSP